MVVYKNGVGVRKSNDYGDKEVTNAGGPTTFPNGEFPHLCILNPHSRLPCTWHGQATSLRDMLLLVLVPSSPR